MQRAAQAMLMLLLLLSLLTARKTSSKTTCKEWKTKMHDELRAAPVGQFLLSPAS